MNGLVTKFQLILLKTHKMSNQMFLYSPSTTRYQKNPYIEGLSARSKRQTDTHCGVATIEVSTQTRKRQELENSLTKLDEIICLTHDWDYDDAEAVDRMSVRHAKQFINLLMLLMDNPKFDRYDVSPTRSGGVRLEWERNKQILRVFFEPGEQISSITTNGASMSESKDEVVRVQKSVLKFLK